MTDTTLIFTVAAGFTMAFVLGLLAFKLRLSPIVGYLAAGIVIGPYTPGMVANSQLAAELSELGIILLMFGVGLHFSTKDLLAVSKAAYLGAIPQIALSAVGGWLVALAFGFSWGTALIFGLALSVASTVVVISALENKNLLVETEGRVSIGWLLAQDLALVFFLVLVPPLAEALKQPIFDWSQFVDILPNFLFALTKAAAFIAAMLFAGRKFFPWLLTRVANTGSRELFTLFVIGVPIGIALLAAHLFSVSMALGAFLAGIVLNESDLSHHAAAKALPLQDAFAVLFFVATGMSFSPTILQTHTALLLAGVTFVVLFNPAVAFVLMTGVIKYSAKLAGTVAAGLAQIGEFSILLASLCLRLGIVSDSVFNAIVAIALLSICLHSLSFAGLQLVFSKLTMFQSSNDTESKQGDSVAVANHVVLVGFGRVGAVIFKMLIAENIPVIVIEENKEIADRLNASGISCVYGDAQILAVLEKARVRDSKLLVVTATDPLATRMICDHAHVVNNELAIIARTHSEEELNYLEKRPGVKLVVFAEREIAATLSKYIAGVFEKGRREL